MKKSLAALLLIASLLSTGGAHAESWTLDKAQSTLKFSGTQAGTPFEGGFGTFDAQIDFDPLKPAEGHAVVTIDMASARTGDKQRDETIPGADWFDTAAFPKAVFEATGFQALGGDRYEALGTLSIRGVKKAVTLPFTFDNTGGTATVDGKLPLVRTDYGVGQGEWSSGEWVGLDVTVTLHLVAKPKSTP